MPYAERDHTADLAFEIWGKTMDEVFMDGGKAILQTLIRHPEAIRPQHVHNITLEEETLEDLFHRFLSEFVFRMDAYAQVFWPKEVHVVRQEDRWVLHATLHGEDFDPHRHGMNHHIKSITYHDLTLEPSPEGYRAFLIVDV